ncbi:MAG: imidazole glycerol phosphate synthase subunit HisH [Vicinamibacterales bacterium]|jgi:glutamine amidotransferase
MRVAIVNYGMGNLASVRRALEDLGADAFVAAAPASLADANRIVLPGVGAYSEGMKGLAAGGWLAALHDAVGQQRKPLLGICLGMQMLASGSDEGEAVPGLGFVPGQVKRLDTIGCRLRVPHVGWNEVRYRADDELFAGIPDGSDFYFVHSYAVVPAMAAHLLATTPYGCEVSAAVRNGNVFGTQFHPEKSSKAGRQLLRNFLDYRPC